MQHSCKSKKRTETACDIHFCLWLLYLECFIDIKIASNNIRDGLDEMCVTVWAITFLSYGRDLVLLAVINVDLKVGSVVDFLIGCLRLVCSLINSPQTCPPFHIKWKVWINTKCRLNGCTPHSWNFTPEWQGDLIAQKHWTLFKPAASSRKKPTQVQSNQAWSV